VPIEESAALDNQVKIYDDEEENDGKLIDERYEHVPTDVDLEYPSCCVFSFSKLTIISLDLVEMTTRFLST
jgi:hypothetical protein